MLRLSLDKMTNVHGCKMVIDLTLAREQVDLFLLGTRFVSLLV